MNSSKSISINRRQSIRYINEDEDGHELLTFNSLERGNLDEDFPKTNSFMYNSEEDVYRLNSYKRSRLTERANSYVEKKEEIGDNYPKKEDQNVFSNIMEQNKECALYGILFSYLIFCLIEIIFGCVSKSLTLMADAILYFSESSCFVIYIIIINITKKVPINRRAFALYIGDILALLVKATFLIGLSFWLFYYTILRFRNFQSSNGLIIMIIGIISTLFNIIMGLLLFFFGINTEISLLEKQNINGNNNSEEEKYNRIQDCLINAIYKAIKNILIIIVGILIFFMPSVLYIDPSFSSLFILLLLYKGFSSIRIIIKILMEGKICQIDLNELKHNLKSIQGVIKVDDLHIWSLSNKDLAMSCHIICSDPQNVFSLARDVLNQKYNIKKSTFELELNDDKLNK